MKSIFPEARFIYVKRHGLASIKSLINGWLNPDRFITFCPPDPVKIVGYDRPEWKFIMPEGWRQFNNRHLAELCIWQWKVCHENILASLSPSMSVDFHNKIHLCPSDAYNSALSISASTTKKQDYNVAQ